MKCNFSSDLLGLLLKCQA
uniref:60S ribosomal protein L23a-like n=1 Tax=Rhizophora mucronata TaxID=61149 RepID=A0A2P2KUB8_RHIMU